jgi:hypothetical protein
MTTADRVALVGMHDWTDPMLRAIAAESGLSVFSLTRWRSRAERDAMTTRYGPTVGLDVAHPRFGGLQLPCRHLCLHLPALEHRVAAVLRGDLRVHEP